MGEFADYDASQLEAKLAAIESIIRDYTNNNFQQPRARIACPSLEGMLTASSPLIRPGDTVEISESPNEGLYTVSATTYGTILSRDLLDCPHNLVTKVSYPPAVVDGALNMLRWDLHNRSKVGIKSETLSRYSVSYYDQDSNNTVMGYPVSLLGFCDPYMKPVF